MTYPCPFETCPETFEDSREAALHVRFGHGGINYSAAEPGDFEDVGVHDLPPRPWHRKVQGRTVA